MVWDDMGIKNFMNRSHGPSWYQNQSSARPRREIYQFLWNTLKYRYFLENHYTKQTSCSWYEFRICAKVLANWVVTS